MRSIGLNPRHFPNRTVAILLRLSLVAVFLSSCAPAAVTATPEPLPTALIEPTSTQVPPTETVSIAPTETILALPTDTPAPTPFPVATSRGPNLEATDPTGVSLASGRIQFVEFFRFT